MNLSKERMNSKLHHIRDVMARSLRGLEEQLSLYSENGSIPDGYWIKLEEEIAYMEFMHRYISREEREEIVDG